MVPIHEAQTMHKFHVLMEGDYTEAHLDMLGSFSGIEMLLTPLLMPSHLQVWGKGQLQKMVIQAAVAVSTESHRIWIARHM